MPTILRNTDKEDEATFRAILESVDLPPSVVEYRITMDYDWTDDPAAYILFLLRDDLSDEAFQEEASAIREMLRERLWHSGTERIPYPSFRFKWEQDELERKGYKGR